MMTEFQKGEQHMLRKIIMISNRHKNLKEFNEVLEKILKQHENVFNNFDEYLVN